MSKLRADDIVFERTLRLYGREDYITEFNLQGVIEGLQYDVKSLQEQIDKLKSDVHYLDTPC